MAEDEAQQRQRWSRSYAEHIRELLRARLRVASCLVAAIFILDGVFEALVQRSAFRQTFWVRIVVATSGLGVFFLTGLRAASRFAYFLGILLILAVAIDVEHAIVATGGLSSPYYAGLLVLLIGVGLLAPIDLKLMAGVAVLIWLVFLSPLLIQPAPDVGRIFLVNAFFLLTATVVSLVACSASSALRKRDYFSQQALATERAKSERLLLNVLPRTIADRLRDDQRPIADGFAEATVLFADIVGFTSASDTLPPEEIVGLLNQVFSEFDLLTDKHGLEKIKTIGDAYMVAGGLPDARENHAEAIADLALEMLAILPRFEIAPGRPLEMRIGINTGPVVAGVIGVRKFIYDLWGDTVNTASRMESHGVRSSIQVSRSTFEKLKDSYLLEPRGTIEVKGKGPMETWLLKGRQPRKSEERPTSAG